MYLSHCFKPQNIFRIFANCRNCTWLPGKDLLRVLPLVSWDCTLYDKGLQDNQHQAQTQLGLHGCRLVVQKEWEESSLSSPDLAGRWEGVIYINWCIIVATHWEKEFRVYELTFFPSTIVFFDLNVLITFISNTKSFLCFQSYWA